MSKDIDQLSIVSEYHINATSDTISRLGHQEDAMQPLVGKNTDNIDNVANNANKERFCMKTSIRYLMNQH